MIEVVEYDEAWPALFERLRDTYAAALASAGVPFVAIEHVGSTSVPGLAAKPVIDCDIVVGEQHVEAASDVLVALGFNPVGEPGDPAAVGVQAPGRLAAEPHVRRRRRLPGAPQPPRGARRPARGRDAARRVRRREAAGGDDGRRHRGVRPGQERRGAGDPARRGPQRRRARLHRRQQVPSRDEVRPL